MAYDYNSVPRFTSTYKNAAGAITDPTTAAVTVAAPDGTTTTYNYPADAQLVKSAAGVYYIDVTLNQYGWWTVTFAGTGTVADTEPITAYVGGASTNYITLDNFNTFGATDISSNGTLASVCIAAACRAIDAHCGRRFYLDAAATSRRYRADHSHRLEVDDFGTVTGLVVASDTGDNGTYDTTWATTDVEVEPINGLLAGLPWAYTTLRAVGNQLFPHYGWPVRSRVQVTARWGWPTVPEAVSMAAYVLTLDLFGLKEAAYGVVGSAEFGMFRIRQNPQVQLLLKEYVRHGALVG